MPLASVVTVGIGLLLGTSFGAAARPTDCFQDLMRGTGEEIVCQFPVQPSADERRDLEKQTRGYLKDVACLVAIRVPRRLVDEALNTPDYDFATDPQPVRCTVTAQWRDKQPAERVDITATFAPKVSIRAGRAIDATPGLADVSGVPRALSWPVETFVNSGIGIKGNMLQVINAWLDHVRHSPPVRRQAQR